MKAEATYSAAAALLREGVHLHAARKHRFTLRPSRLEVLELEDVLFGLNSAVMMPYALPESDDAPPPDADALQGLDILYVVYQYAREHPDRQLLVTGHTDTLGGAHHNLELSEARARAVYALLAGRRTEWAELCHAWHRVSDIQRLLKFYRGIDPGAVDDDLGPRTRDAIAVFQAVYNADRQALGVPNHPALVEDGVMGPRTWEGMFDYYQFSLAQLLGCGPDWTLRALLGLEPVTTTGLDPNASDGGPGAWVAKMQAWRDSLHLLDPPFLGCGESFPVEEARRDNYRSKANRRVELLFFEPQDVPAVPRRPPQSGTYTFADCPFFDPAAYAPRFIDADVVFEHVLMLQTVDEMGHPVPNAALKLFPLRGGEVTVQSDGDGFCLAEDLPPGRVRVCLDDGSPAAIQLGGQYLPAVLATHRAADEDILIASVIVKTVLSEEERAERRLVRRLYGPSPARSPKPGQPAVAPSVGPREGAEGGEEHIVELPFKAHDNLALVAGWTGRRTDVKALHAALDASLRDYHPVVRTHGFLLLVLIGDRLLCFGKDGELARSIRLRPGIAEQIVGPIGAYTAFATPGDPMFRDVPTLSYGVGLADWDDELGTIPLTALIPESAHDALRDFFAANLRTVHVLYRAPTGGQLFGLALGGGAGYLEDYAADGSTGAHARNVATVRRVADAYRSDLAGYIRKVEDIGKELDELEPIPDFDELQKRLGTKIRAKDELDRLNQERERKVKEAERALKKIGPPRRVYHFPKPLGISDEQWLELVRANNISEYQAWVAIADKLDELSGVHSEGAVFLRVKYTLSAKSEANGTSPYGEVKLEHTIDVGSDGFFHKRDQLAVFGGQIGGLTSQRIPNLKHASAGLEGEVNLETGEKKTTAKLGYRTFGMELADDGGFKLSGPNGAAAEYNDLTKEAGGGVTIPTPYGDLYVGLHFKGIFEETVAAYLTRAPGFFERRLVSEYFDTESPLLWNNLTPFEQDNLAVMGWDMRSWDRRGETAFEAFPKAVQEANLSALMEPHPEIFMAAVRLGFDRDDWKQWKSTAKKPEPSEPEPVVPLPPQ